MFGFGKKKAKQAAQFSQAVEKAEAALSAKAQRPSEKPSASPAVSGEKGGSDFDRAVAA